MKIGFIGLGKMGFNMVLNLIEKNHAVIGFDLNKKFVNNLSKKGMVPADNIKDLINKLPAQKVIWLMIPAGKPVDSVIRKLLPYLKKGDIVIDGGNSFYKDSQRHCKLLKKKGIYFLDVGTSGGISGARYGACMMIGGDNKAFKKTEKIYKDLCVKNGYGYMGKSGSGHFVKMVHNGIEYGMMGALAEGFELIKKQSKVFGTDIKEVSKVYAHGSIIAGNLTSWLWDSFRKTGYLERILCEVPKGATEDEMKLLEKMGNMHVLKQARLIRKRSRKGLTCGKLIAAMRNQFGGHAVIRGKGGKK